MSEKYNHKKIEKKWAEKWVKDKSFTPNLEKAKDPYYALFMFPYPSAEGLHIGNFYAFICVDVMAKYKRLQGKAVFEPIGFDAFGMHSENYALKINETPRKMLNRTIANFRKQLSSAGLGCDWTREVDTTTSEYYKWTQWIFTKLFEKGLAYQKEALLNWCPGCKTVLADEQIEDGVCERCKTAPEKKTMKQWFLKITAYAQRLLDGLDDMDWSEITKHAQRNWIGRSEGAKIVFKAKSQKSKVKNEIEVFTTRPDTLFGATYMVLSPEHSLVKKIITPEHKKEVEEYIKKSGAKSDLERAEAKEKTGVFTGAYAVNPVNNEKISIWIADYVLTGYGTGAIMAVPAHDERDFEFAKKYNLPIKKVVIPIFGDKHEQEEYRETITALIYRKKDNKFLYLDDNHYKIVAPIIGGIEKGESIKDAAEREAYEETGYKARFVKKLGGQIESHFFASHKNVWRHRLDQPVLCELLDENAEPDEISKEEDNKHKVIWITAEEALKRIAHGDNKMGLLKYLGKAEVFTGEGRNVNSISLNGLTTKEAKEKMIKWLEEKKVGKKTINYKLRDWCISRQRYWGPPVPIVYCDKCGVQSVPEKDLPVKLPEMEKDWEPAGDGRGPLAKVDGFMKTVCPKCGGFAEREPDVMDNFLDSAWYFFRYIDTKNGKEIFDKKLGKKWLPVDFYVGGNEHAVLHLMYTRFITMALHDLGLINFDNPFKKFRANGMILKDGKKMSKSKGNVVNPEEYGEKIGYDALKTYLLFLGPLSEDRSFSDAGTQGTKRWVEKIFRLEEKVSNNYKDSENTIKKFHQTIKAVTDDFENQKYNTAIARLMEFTNTLSAEKNISSQTWEKFLILAAPFVPALAEELYEKLNAEESIFKQKWPEYNPELIKDELINLAVQINGKFRGTIETEVDVSEDEAKKIALKNEKIKKWIENKEIIKIIFIKGRLINIIIK